MRVNGTISRLCTRPQSATFNEDGEPVVMESVWAEPVECFIYERYVDGTASYGDGKYTSVSYDIIVEGSFFRNTERVKLTRYGDDMGEFPVKHIKRLSVYRTIVTV